jgi:tetratricopeptide (TPR) repeat protein
VEDFNEVIHCKPNEIAAFTGRGYAHFQKRDWDEAIDDFKAAIQLNPRNGALYRNLGRVYLTRGEWDEAITNFTQSVRLNLRDDWAYNCRAVAQEGKGNLEAAIADYQAALRISPDYANVYVNCGLLLQYQKHALDIAILDYSEALRLDPTNADTYLVRADAYWEKKSYAQAGNDFTRAVELQPTQAEYYFRRGNFQFRMTNYTAAASDYDEGARLGSTNCWDWNQLGYFHERMTNFVAAISNYTWCIQLAPTNAGFHAARAHAEEVTAKSLGPDQKTAVMDQALDDWNEAVALDSHWLIGLGEFECRKGLYEAAVDDFTDYLVAYPTNFFALASRALTYERMAAAQAKRGELEKRNAALDQALADWNRLLVWEPGSHAESLCGRGDYYAQTAQFAKALADYQQAVNLAPTNDFPLISLSWFLATCPDKSYRNGAQAVTNAQRACTLASEKSWFHLAGLAAALAETGKYGEAVQLQKQALALPGCPEFDRADMLHRLSLYERNRPCHRILGLGE